MYNQTARILEKTGLSSAPQVVLHVLVTFHLVAFAWIFFRAASIHDAWQIISHLPVNLSHPPRMLASQFSTYLSWTAAACFIFMELISYWNASAHLRFYNTVRTYCRYPVLVVILLVTSLLGLSSSQFIYFHF